MATTNLEPTGPWIKTRFGTFHVDNPVFDIRDIAHALAFIVRFNGHVERFYSVAEHSALVCALMAIKVGGDPLEGLMHDATEAYLSDVPKPFKQRLPELGEWDAKLELAMRTQFNLPLEITPECKKADWLALAIEAICLLEDKGESFTYPPGIYEEALELISLGWKVDAYPPAAARGLWHGLYTHYSHLKNETEITENAKEWQQDRDSAAGYEVSES